MNMITNFNLPFHQQPQWLAVHDDSQMQHRGMEKLERKGGIINARVGWELSEERTHLPETMEDW